MSAAETIAAAIDRLEAQQRQGYRVDGDWLVEVADGCTCAGGTIESHGMHERGCGLVPLTNDPLIVMLYRTIDAQLAILWAAQIEHTDIMTDIEKPYWAAAVDLARAILGEAS